MVNKASDTSKDSKSNKTRSKRLSKGQRTHARRLKQEARKAIGGPSQT